MRQRKSVALMHVGNTEFSKAMRMCIEKKYGGLMSIFHFVWDNESGPAVCMQADLVLAFVENHEAVAYIFDSLRKVKKHSPDAVVVIAWKGNADESVMAAAATLAEEFFGIFPCKTPREGNKVLEELIFNTYRIICDGCKGDLQKHHCCGSNAIVSGVRIGRPCQCIRCRESEALLAYRRAKAL